MEPSLPFLTRTPSWVSDLVWLDDTEYDPTTGAGALGAEFAGTGKHLLKTNHYKNPHKANHSYSQPSPPTLHSAPTPLSSKPTTNLPS